MPAYNFKDQFADAVESGTKPHTIREVRTRPTRPGETLFLYTGMRTAACRLLRVATCTKVTPIKIHTGLCPAVILDEKIHMKSADVDALATRDGFANAEAFFNFFKRTYGECFQGELIEWNPSRGEQLATLTRNFRGLFSNWRKGERVKACVLTDGVSIERVQWRGSMVLLCNSMSGVPLEFVRINPLPGARAVGVKAVCTPQARALGAGEQSPAATPTMSAAKKPQPISP